MPTKLTTAEMKQLVIQHFEDFVNNRKSEVIRVNMTEDFYDHDGPGGKPAGIDGDEKMMQQMYQAMPTFASRYKTSSLKKTKWRAETFGIGRTRKPRSESSFTALFNGASQGIRLPSVGLP